MFKSVSSNWIRMFVSIGVVFMLTPFLFRRLGDEGYGQWSLINAFVGNLSLLIMGVPMASVHFMTGAVGRNDATALNRAIATCLGVYLGLGLLAILTGGALFAWYIWGYPVPESMQDGARMAFLVMVVGSGIGFALQLPYGIIVAHHDFGLYNKILIIGIVMRFGLTLALMSLTDSLPLLAVIPVFTTLFEAGVAVMVIRKRYPEVRLNMQAFDRTTVKAIFGFSVFVLLINLGSRLAFQIDGMVIGAYRPAEDVGIYNFGNQFMVYLMEIILGIANVVMPLASRLHAQNREHELRGVFLRWSKAALTIVLGVGLYLLVLGPEFLGWWVGEAVQERAGEVLQILTISFIIYLPLRGVAMPALSGLGQIKSSALLLLGMGALNLLLSLILVQPYGLRGVALGTAIPNVLFAVVMLLIACKRLKVGVGEWLAYVAWKPLLSAVPMLGLLLWMKLGIGIHGIVALVLAGIAHCVFFGLLEVFWVYRKDPYFDPWKRFRSKPEP